MISHRHPYLTHAQRLSRRVSVQLYRSAGPRFGTRSTTPNSSPAQQVCDVSARSSSSLITTTIADASACKAIPVRGFTMRRARCLVWNGTLIAVQGRRSFACYAQTILEALVQRPEFAGGLTFHW
jgi:hypothetical protein